MLPGILWWAISLFFWLVAYGFPVVIALWVLWTFHSHYFKSISLTSPGTNEKLSTISAV